MNLNISSDTLKQIKRQLPKLKQLLLEDQRFLEQGAYQQISLSIFDHWLTPEEAISLIYVDDQPQELTVRRQKFKAFLEALFHQTELFTWRYKRHQRLHIQQLTMRADVLRKGNFEQLWSKSGRRYGFLLPEYSAVYLEGWDWTNQLWYIDRSSIQPMLQEAQKAGLFMLD